MSEAIHLRPLPFGRCQFRRRFSRCGRHHRLDSDPQRLRKRRMRSEVRSRRLTLLLLRQMPPCAPRTRVRPQRDSALPGRSKRRANGLALRVVPTLPTSLRDYADDGLATVARVVPSGHGGSPPGAWFVDARTVWMATDTTDTSDCETRPTLRQLAQSARSQRDVRLHASDVFPRVKSRQSVCGKKDVRPITNRPITDVKRLTKNSETQEW